MKRQTLAILLHPYKNILMPPAQLKESADIFIRNLLEITSECHNIRFNVVMPGYILDQVDPLLLSSIRDVQKRGGLEWLVTGHTEPSLSFSPPWLCRENIRRGIEDITGLLGGTVGGYVPAFSDWEPSYIETIKGLGLHYSVLSSIHLPPEYRQYCGFWATEYLGSSMVFFPVHTLHHFNAPAAVDSWLEKLYAQDTQKESGIKLLCLRYLLPLVIQEGTDPYQWLRQTARTLDHAVLDYQTVLFNDFLSNNAPIGLQYLPASLIFNQDMNETVRPSANWLFTYDQVGVLHRKMLEICDAVAPLAQSKNYAKLVQQLFYVQDINRYLPGRHSGFNHLTDRLWTYRHMIAIEEELRRSDEPKGGQIRISDHLRNGSKSIVMTNKALKAYIDHRAGGTIFELDVRETRLNVGAGFDTRLSAVPSIIEPGKSRTMFVDHFLPPATTMNEFVAGGYQQLGNFIGGRFDYKIKKSGTGAKAVLSRQGAITQGDKLAPLSMEKVFGLDGEKSDLSFVYQLVNRSLTPYSFLFAAEITLTLPGLAENNGRLICGKTIYKDLVRERVALEQITELTLEDRSAGIKVLLKTQKAVTVWCFPSPQPGVFGAPYQGTTLVITAPVELDQSASWTLMGKLIFKKSRSMRRGTDDAV